jgi:two-component system response regulator RegA
MSDASTSANRRVLIVEDDTKLLELLTAAFERRSGVSVIGVTTVRETRDVLQTESPELCIVDFKLPDGTGLDVIREIRARRPAARVVLLTGYGTLEVGAAAIRAGADEVMAKPASLSEIMQRLQRTESAASANTPSADRALWEHMHRVLGDCEGNKSLAARKLGIDRGTLQRWLDRGAPC